MRFVYTDEAGISAKEPVTVVVGLVVHADKEWMRATDLVSEALTKVPEKFRENFTFHATAVWGSHKYRPDWTFEDRLALLRRMMSIPNEVGCAIAFKESRRDNSL